MDDESTVFEEMQKMAKNNEVEVKYSSLAKGLGYNISKLYKILAFLEKEGKIKLLRKAKNGGKGAYVPALFEILTSSKSKPSTLSPQEILDGLKAIAINNRIEMSYRNMAKHFDCGINTLIPRFLKLVGNGQIIMLRKPINGGRGKFKPALWEIVTEKTSENINAVKPCRLLLNSSAITILEVLQSQAENNIVEINYREMGRQLDCSPSKVAFNVKRLAADGKIRLIRPSNRNNFPAVWEIVTEAKSFVNNPQEIKPEFLHEEMFNGNTVRIIQHNGQPVIPLVDVCKALGYSRAAGRALLMRNIELFSDQMVVCVTRPSSDVAKNYYLTRDGIIGFLMKISTNRLTNKSKQLVIDFQKWAITTLGTLIQEGEIHLTRQQQESIKQDLGDIISISEEQINVLFTGIDQAFAMFVEKHGNLNETNENCKKEISAQRISIDRLTKETMRLREKLYAR